MVTAELSVFRVAEDLLAHCILTRLHVEGRLPEHEVERLREKGHEVDVGEDYIVPVGGAQVIRVHEDGVRSCGSDPRKDGCALAQGPGDNPDDVLR